MSAAVKLHVLVSDGTYETYGIHFWIKNKKKIKRYNESMFDWFFRNRLRDDGLFS